MLARIAHTTDFSPESAVAFLHALRLALTARARLDLLHVKDHGQDDSWDSFPQVREPLVRWGLLDAKATPADIEAKLGVRVAKIEIDHRDATRGISEFFLTHRPDLVVIATHGRQGVNRWLHGSVSEDVARRVHVPTLLIGPHSRGFVAEQSGQLSLRRILLPVVPTPSPARALDMLSELLSPVGVTRDSFELMHIANTLPEGLADTAGGPKIEHLGGPVVETILRVAEERKVDLIAMPTAGQHGFLDVFRGSTTSRVLPHAPCPVLTWPLIVPTRAAKTPPAGETKDGKAKEA
jgi:nucleotide-binding universal stress UspA family protein